MVIVAKGSDSTGLTLHQRLGGLESAFHAAPIGLCVLDLSFRYVIVNPCFARMYGLAEEDFAGRTVAEVLPEPAAQIMAHLRSALEADGIVEREITLGNPTAGRDRSVRDERIYLRTAQPVRDESGQVYGLSVALLDITERKRTDAALRESEENLRYTVELTPHIPWTADPTGELTFMSPRWNSITGGRPGTVLLEDWAEVLHPKDLEKTAGIWARSVASGEPYDAEYRIRSVDGGWRWVRARAYPRRAANGEIVRWYGTVEDIHDRKLTAMQLEKATEELARTAQEDHLTGLFNRRQFDDVLGREIDRAARTKLPLALIMLDVDHFKSYNDRSGHLAGDQCLKTVATALKAVICRPWDFAARYGGEEFAIVLPDTALEGALLVAERAVAAVRELALAHPDAELQRVTISAGVAMHEAGTESTRAARMSRLVDAADKALYKAKAAGRNRVEQ